MMYNIRTEMRYDLASWPASRGRGQCDPATAAAEAAAAATAAATAIGDVGIF